MEQVTKSTSTPLNSIQTTIPFEEDLNSLGFRVLNIGGKRSVSRENTAGEFRRRLEDLNSSCKFVFNCLRTRYPGLQIFKENKNKNYTSSNLPQLVISGLDSGIGKDGNDYFMNENSIYQSDAGGVYDSSRKGFIDGISLRLPTICVRPGKPNKAASGFFSNIIRAF